jgi:hypothetical protein
MSARAESAEGPCAKNKRSAVGLVEPAELPGLTVPHSDDTPFACLRLLPFRQAVLNILMCRMVKSVDFGTP